MSTTTPSARGDRRAVWSWCFFDFANSPFTTVIITVVYARYFASVVAPDETGAELWSLVLAVSNALIILSAPVVGAIADHLRRKKRFLFISYATCIAATAALFFVGPGDVWPAMALILIANTAFATGENLISGFLPEIAAPEDMPRISARAWAVGYVGGLLALGISLWLVMGVGGDLATRTTCLVVAAIFFLGGLPTFLFVPEHREGEARGPMPDPIRAGFRGVLETWRQRGEMPALFRFLTANLVFMIGLYGVIAFASIYGEKLFGLDDETIIQVFIVLQIVAAGGALGAGRLARAIGVRRTLDLALVCWIIAGSIALFTSSPAAYWVISVFAGLAMGATLPTARTAVALLTPPAMEAEVFGYWGLAGRLAGVLANAGNAALLFAARRWMDPPQHLRAGIVYFVAAFVLGIILLRRVADEPRLD